MRRRCIVLVSALAVVFPLAAEAADADVKVSSIGYLPSRVKRASITATATDWQLVRDGDGQVMSSGKLGSVKTDPDTGQSIAVADFTSVAEPGRYYVEVPGVGRSVTFAIGPDVYREAFVATMLGFYGWRCNTAVSLAWKGQTYAHAACHMDDAHTDYLGSAGQRDGTKGWHDAGDYGKYTVNAGITVGSLLAAWEEYRAVIETYHWPIPESGGPLPDFLAEIRWELEWVLKMQYSGSDGRVSHKLTSLTFDAPSDSGGDGIERWVMPENDTMPRYFVPMGTAATADFVAMLAKAARVYKPYDAAFAEQCLGAARVSYAYLQANTADQRPTDPTSTGGYGTTDADDRLWAAAEMWEATGDAAALADFETRAAKFGSGTSTYVDSDFDWGNVKNLGVYVYLLSQRTGKNATTESAIKSALLKAADTLVTQHNGSGYGRALSGKSGHYYWGSNGSVARTCMLLQVANRLSPKADYLDTCADQIAWIFGRNYYNRSLVTGIGLDPPMHPHHRPSVADGIEAPWPGLLVGGGNSTSTQANGNKNGATNWLDDVDAYELNEVAINWNAPLTYALASFLDVYTGPGDTDAAIPGGDASGAGGGSGGAGGSASGGAGGSASGGAGGGSAKADGGTSPASGGSGGAGGEAGTGGHASGGAGGEGGSGAAAGGASGGAGGGGNGGSAGNASSSAGGTNTGGFAGSAGGVASGGQSGTGGTPKAGSETGCSCNLGRSSPSPVAPVVVLLLGCAAALSARRRCRDGR
ncbi:MAG: glycoside hydrolase family 9 protein [Deltaproteobacteria bacterium]|nr:glycoside hydrolase family 9 protein [Deltaproteobacteria bacterium]